MRRSLLAPLQYACHCTARAAGHSRGTADLLLSPAPAGSGRGPGQSAAAGRRHQSVFSLPKATALKMLKGRPAPAAVTVDILLAGEVYMQQARCIVRAASKGACGHVRYWLGDLVQQLPTRDCRVGRYEAPGADGSGCHGPRWRVHVEEVEVAVVA